ncbi:hypothetical protein C8J56DRAFT_1042004 [Mycena floridula]|nr:hypothetical protein C8J56DRAFT_1042004 [Mycena floridula]
MEEARLPLLDTTNNSPEETVATPTSARPFGETGKALPTTDRDTSRHRWASSNRCVTGSTALGREASLEDRILDALCPRFGVSARAWSRYAHTKFEVIVSRICILNMNHHVAPAPAVLLCNDCQKVKTGQICVFCIGKGEQKMDRAFAASIVQFRQWRQICVCGDILMCQDCFKVLEIARTAPNVVEQENMEMHVEIDNVARTDVDILMDGGDGQNNV